MPTETLVSHSDERFGDEEDSAETAGSRRGPGRPRKTAVERAVDDPRLATEREATEREIAEEIEDLKLINVFRADADSKALAKKFTFNVFA